MSEATYFRGYRVPWPLSTGRLVDMLGKLEEMDCASGAVCGTCQRDCIYYPNKENRYALAALIAKSMEDLMDGPEGLWRTWAKSTPEIDPETEDADLDAAENDPVAHPAHYCVGGIECIDVMERVFGTEAVKTFCRLNAFKYLFRSENKNGRQDIDKAHWYTGKYGELCDKIPIAPLKGARSGEQADAIKSAIIRLVDIAQEEARKDCEPTLAVWDAVDKLYDVLGLDYDEEEDDE